MKYILPLLLLLAVPAGAHDLYEHVYHCHRTPSGIICLPEKPIRKTAPKGSVPRFCSIYCQQGRQHFSQDEIEKMGCEYPGNK